MVLEVSGDRVYLVPFLIFLVEDPDAGSLFDLIVENESETSSVPQQSTE